jgi:hypothetical protein
MVMIIASNLAGRRKPGRPRQRIGKYECEIIQKQYIYGFEGETMDQNSTRTEEFQINGDEIISKLKELLHEGNIRRITIKNEEGKTIVDIPLTISVVGILLAPQLAAIGAIAALVTRCTLVVEKSE